MTTRLLILLSLAASLTAQVQPSTALLLGMATTTPVPVKAPATLTVAITGTGNTAVDAVQFEITAAPGTSMPAQGATVAPNLAGKTLFCANRLAPDLSEIFCLLIGTTSTTVAAALSDGPLLSIPITTPSTPGVSLLTMVQPNTIGAAPLGDDAVAVPILANSLSYPISPSPCDINGDGNIDASDITAATLGFTTAKPGSIGWALTILNVQREIDAVFNGGTCNVR